MQYRDSNATKEHTLGKHAQYQPLAFYGYQSSLVRYGTRCIGVGARASRVWVSVSSVRCSCCRDAQHRYNDDDRSRTANEPICVMRWLAGNITTQYIDHGTKYLGNFYTSKDLRHLLMSVRSLNVSFVTYFMSSDKDKTCEKAIWPLSETDPG